MVKLRLNREFLLRHTFSLLVFLALGGWFAFDASVRYPRTDARELYMTIEKSAPPDGFDLKSFKEQKMRTQLILALVTLVAATGIGLHLLSVSRLAFSFDDDSFEYGTVKYSYSDVSKVDVSKWSSKGILSFYARDKKIALDAWHHSGVKEFYEKLNSRVDFSAKI